MKNFNMDRNGEFSPERARQTPKDHEHYTMIWVRWTLGLKVPATMTIALIKAIMQGAAFSAIADKNPREDFTK